ncbi:hypothetical protein ZIOFF_032078 [Zingiber officinale]|uniref:Transposase n=1 Tax=Zingiber officinale TaxID=94328 RepID=A0A8J5L0X5_ZINOF|nr:hypothetical protein ZIOFF_032078 [Zingiber officinale]
MKAIIGLHAEFIKQPDGSEIPPHIESSNRFYPYFKDYVGALDGTHICVKVSDVDAPRYRGRKDWPTTNVLVGCSFDLKFIYVLAGWEGTASDSRIIKNALSKRDKLIIPHVKRDVIEWTEEMDRIFIDAILEQQVNGNRIGGTFTSTAYKDMVVICSEKIEISLTNDNLNNRIKTLKSHFNSCYDLFKNASGVQWHAKSRRFEDEEAVWKQLIDVKEEQRDLGLDDEYENFEVIPDSPPFDDRLRKRKLASIDSYGSKKNLAIDINVKEVVAAIDRSTSVIENRSFRQQNINEKLYKALVCVGVPGIFPLYDLKNRNFFITLPSSLKGWKELFFYTHLDLVPSYSESWLIDLPPLPGIEEAREHCSFSEFLWVNLLVPHSLFLPCPFHPSNAQCSGRVSAPITPTAKLGCECGQRYDELTDQANASFSQLEDELTNIWEDVTILANCVSLANRKAQIFRKTLETSESSAKEKWITKEHQLMAHLE